MCTVVSGPLSAYRAKPETRADSDGPLHGHRFSTFGPPSLEEESTRQPDTSRARSAIKMRFRVVRNGFKGPLRFRSILSFNQPRPHPTITMPSSIWSTVAAWTLSAAVLFLVNSAGAQKNDICAYISNGEISAMGRWIPKSYPISTHCLALIELFKPAKLTHTLDGCYCVNTVSQSDVVEVLGSAAIPPLISMVRHLLKLLLIAWRELSWFSKGQH